MNTEQRIAYKHILKQLEAMAVSGAIPADYATDTSLINIENAINSLKDGEFRILSDPNDNDRLVGLTADMTNPAVPVYVYRYLDDNTAYAGNVNDLQAGTTAATTALLLYRKPQYYISGSGANITATPSVNGNITFGYNNGVTGGALFDDGGALQGMGSFANLGALLTALNASQTIFEFYQFTAPELARIGSNETIIGIRSNDYLVNEQWANVLGLTIDGVGFGTNLYTLSDNTTTQDVMLDKLEKSVIHQAASSGYLSAIASIIVSIYTYLTITFANYFRPTEAIMDGAGRWRVSEPVTLFNCKHTVGAEPLLWDDQETSGGGTTTTHVAARSSVDISVGANTAGTRVRQTFMRFNYQSFKSQLIGLTVTPYLTGGGAGITNIFGYGDDANGIFMKFEDYVCSVGIRSSVSGSPVDTWVDSSFFNMNPAFIPDPTKGIILVIDFQWLGFGDVRIGVKSGNTIMYLHRFETAGISPNVFMTTANLPLRYEISNDGTGAATTMSCVCSTVISEGGTEDLGVIRYTPSPTTALSVPLAGVIYMLRGYRLKTTHFSITNRFLNFSIICTTNDDYEWMWIRNPTVADVVSFVDEGISSCQTVEGQVLNVVTPGTGHVLAGGVIKGGGGLGVVAVDIPNILTLGAAINGTPDEFYLCVRPFTGTADFYYGVERKEIL